MGQCRTDDGPDPRDLYVALSLGDLRNSVSLIDATGGGGTYRTRRKASLSMYATCAPRWREKIGRMLAAVCGAIVGFFLFR